MTDMVKSNGHASVAAPRVQPITFADVKASFSEGLSDFFHAPMIGLFFGAIYALGGLAIVTVVFAMEMGYLAYPLAAGSVLIGPFVRDAPVSAATMVSRELEAGRTPTFSTVLKTVFAQRSREMSWMAFVTIFAFTIWMYQVRLLLALFLGFANFASLNEFAHVLFTTTDGLAFLAVGHVVGAALALGLFSITVISFPLLMDREVDVVTAMITSVQTVMTSPGPMIAYGIAVVALLVLGALPFFLGLLIVLPVLGHATWHLYRRAVAPAAS